MIVVVAVVVAAAAAVVVSYKVFFKMAWTNFLI